MKQIKFWISLSLVLMPCILLAEGQETYLGLFLQGKRIGYILSSEEKSSLGSIPVKLSRSNTVMDAGLLGASVRTTIEQSNWSGRDGKPLLLKFVMSSSGRSQRVEANFSKKDVRVAVDNNGVRSVKVLPLPSDGPIVDDAIAALMAGNVQPGAKRSFYVFDPMTVSFVKNTATFKGSEPVEIEGIKVSAQAVVISEPRMSMTAYLSAKGDFLQAVAVGGILLKPISKEEALAPTEGASVDLAEATRIPVTGMKGDVGEYRSVTYRFSGGDLSHAPKDATQAITRDGSDWVVKVSPSAPVAWPEFKTCASLSKSMPMWVQPGLHISSAAPEILAEAARFTASKTSPLERVKMIAKGVHSLMVPNAGIGILRDATEILKTKEGVCRDYAILTAALLRSQKIPARLASGLVYSNQAFYYHAWVEVWDGKKWFGVDSTRPSGQITPGHIKLAHGSVEDAFLFTFLDRTKVEVLNVIRR